MADKKILKYPVESMQAAIDDCRRGMAVATSARIHNVPKTTLLYKVRGVNPEKRKMGPEPLFNAEEEARIVDWIKILSKRKFPIYKSMLISSAQRLSIALGKEEEMRKRKYKIGRKWYEGFMRRHQDISERVSQNLTASRANVTEGQIRNWFQEIEQYLTENDYFKILEDPKRVFNADESAFFLNPKGIKVLAERGNKSIYISAGNDEKECLTVLVNCNAFGQIAPPMIIFRYQRIPAILAESIPGHWGIGRSENGWSTAECFFEYVTNVFHPWLIKQEIVLPIILFVDGHTSHSSMHLSEFCKKNGIILIALFPNSTHLLQPLDVAVFKTLKAEWKLKVAEWKVTTGSTGLKRHEFSPLLNKVLEEKILPGILENGFRKCGLVPWNPDAVDYSKTKGNVVADEVPNNNIETRTPFCETFESLLGEEKLSSFRNN